MRWTLERLWRLHGEVWCMVVMTPVGFRNGYVLVPKGHPFWGRTLAELGDVPAPGGITFSDYYPVEHLENGDGVPEGWWIGFDHAHGWDTPADPQRWAEASGGYPFPTFPDNHPPYSVDVVAAEVEDLAAYVHDVCPP